MLYQSTAVNIAIKTIENICNKFDIRLTDSNKTVLAILIPAIIYRDGTIIILSETIHQIDRVIKRHNEHIDFVSILLGFNCITHIDKYGAITIPLCALLDKLKVNRKVIGRTGSQYLSKKVLTNATQTLCISEICSHIGIPKMLSIPIINLILELANTDIKKERKMLLDANMTFKDKKMSQMTHILKQMQCEKIFLSTAILLVITNIGFNITTSLILINVLSSLYEVAKAEYKMRTAKGFLDP